MNISIFGLGYVGAVSLACLARDGHDVIGVDVDQAKLDLIAAGKTPVVEEGMVELMARRRRERPRRASPTDVARRRRAHAIFRSICVGTPSAPNGSQDQAAMLRLAERARRARCSDKATPHVVRLPLDARARHGRGRAAADHRERVGQADGVDFHVCFQPEFLREGIVDPRLRQAAVHDRRRERAERRGEAAAQLFGHLPCEFYATSIRAAEMVKYCCNNFHALKITFANETARLCEALGVDPFEVMDLVCQDHAAQHLARLPQARLRVRRLVPAQGPARDDVPRQDARRRAADARRASCASNRVHIDHAIAKVLATGKRRDRHDRPVVQDRHRRPAREPAGAAGRALHRQGPERCSSTIPRCTCRNCSAPTGASSSSTCRTSASLIRQELESVVDESEMILLGMSDAKVHEALARRMRPGQPLLDLVGLAASSPLQSRAEGLCW